MKRKHVLALMLAVTAATTMPAQVFAAEETPAQVLSTHYDSNTESTEKSNLEFDYSSENYTSHCRVDSGKIIMNGITMKQGAHNIHNFVFPSTITHNGNIYQVRDIMGIHQDILQNAKTITFSEGIENIVLYPNLLHVDELTLPSTLQSIIGGMTMGEKLPNGDPCIYLKGRVNKVNIPENSRFAYSQKYNCIYDTEITTTNPDKPTIDKSALNEAIKAAENEMIFSDKYTPESISTLKAILEDAKRVFEDENAIQADVDAMTVKVNQAVKELEVKPIVNKAALDEAIKTAEKEMILSDKYTAESISSLKAIVEEAKTLLNEEEATQNVIDEMVLKVNQAVKDLVEKVVIPMTPLEPSIPVEKPEIPLTPLEPALPIKPEVNKSALEEVISIGEREAALTDKYTAESLDKLNKVLDEAKATANNENATQDEINAMVEKVNDALNKLTEKSEIPLTPLEPSKPIEPEKPEPPVEPEKPEIPLTPLEPALPVEPEKPEIPLTPLEPSTPVEKPDVEVVDKSDLEDAIDRAEKEASLTSKYTKDSIANLNAIVKDAKVVLDKSDVTQEEIDAMVEKVNAAVKELVLVKPELKPDDNKKPVVNDKKPTDKTTAPKTGDPASAGMLATLLAGSGATIAVALKKKKIM